MSNCLNCQKEVVAKEGKRAKKFCSDPCRATYYQKTHPRREPKYVLAKTHQQVVEKLAKVEAELRELRNKVRWASEPFGPPKQKLEELVAPRLEEALKGPLKPLPEKYQNLDAPKKETSADEPPTYTEKEKAMVAEFNRSVDEEIAAIRKESVPAHLNTLWGKKNWKLEQQKRIEKLEASKL